MVDEPQMCLWSTEPPLLQIVSDSLLLFTFVCSYKFRFLVRYKIVFIPKI
jgi:hypothetical protein